MPVVCVIILLTMLVPWVFSHTAWLALWIGAGRRSVAVLTSNRFPFPNDMNDSRLLFQFSAVFPVIMLTMRHDHMFSRVNSSSFLSGIIDLSYVHRRFSFLKHDNLMVHHVKAFWIVHHIVCACLIALTDALMFAMLAFIWNAGNGFEDTVFFVMRWWWNLQRSWPHHICSCQETRLSLLSLGLSGNQSICQFLVAGLPGYRIPVVVLNPSWLADAIRRGSACGQWSHVECWHGLAWLFLLLSAMSTYVDEQNCSGSCSSYYGVGWCLLNIWKAGRIASMYQTWWLPFRVFRVESHRFAVACLFPVNTYPVIDGSAWIQSWMIRCEPGCECEHNPACVKSVKDGVIMLCQPKIFSMHMGRDNDVHEPFRTIHGLYLRN